MRWNEVRWDEVRSSSTCMLRSGLLLRLRILLAGMQDNFMHHTGCWTYTVFFGENSYHAHVVASQAVFGCWCRSYVPLEKLFANLAETGLPFDHPLVDKGHHVAIALLLIDAVAPDEDIIVGVDDLLFLRIVELCIDV